MNLPKAIAEAPHKELADLAKYISGELAMETLDIGEDTQTNFQPEAIENILKAWAFTQQHARDGMD